MAAIDDALLPIFASQHWLVSLADVRSAGGDVRSAQRRVANGRWEPMDRGVYRLVGTPISWEARVLAPLLSAGGRALASHHTAAALHQIPGYGRGIPEIAIERGTQHRCEGIVVHTSTDLLRCDVVRIDAIPTTDIGRTILDLARTGSDVRVLRAIEWARRSDKASWSSMISVLARHARRGRPGIRRLRRVIVGNADRDAITDSDFELLFLALVREAGLPEPVLHLKVLDGDRFVAEVDFGYPGMQIAIELDGRIHAESDVRERDLPRQNDLVLLGWIVLRFTWKRFRERPDLIVAEIRAAIRARSAAAA